MRNQISNRPFSQRQLRVGELVKQNLGELFIRNEAKIPLINSKINYGYRSKNDARFKNCKSLRNSIRWR